MFTVIIPNYNMGNYIRASIESVLNQSYQNFELIVIDNCSTDQSWDQAIKCKDDRILFYKQTANLGMYANLNVGIMLAKGKYIKIHCSDDIMHPQCLEVLEKGIHSIQTKSNVPIYFGHDMIVGEIGKEFPTNWINENITTDFVSKKTSLSEEVPTGLPLVCVDTNAFRDFGGFGSPDPQRDFSRDLLRLGLFANTCDCYKIDKPLIFERAHSGQSRFSMKKQWQLNEVYQLFYSTGIINTTEGKNKLKVLAGYHLASSLKYIYVKMSFEYLIHTLNFSIKKGLFGVTYLKSFLLRIK